MPPITDVAPLLLLEARLRMDVHHTPEAVVLTLEGELDLATTPMLKTALALLHAGGTCPLVMLDLAGVGFMDGAGVGCITRAARRLGERGVALAVIHPSRPVRRLLELCDLGRLMRWEGLTAAVRGPPHRRRHWRPKAPDASRRGATGRPPEGRAGPRPARGPRVGPSGRTRGPGSVHGRAGHGCTFGPGLGRPSPAARRLLELCELGELLR